MTELESLGKCRLFAGLGEDLLQLIGTFSSTVEAQKGTILAIQGRPAAAVYVIQQGNVGLESPVPKPGGGNIGPTRMASLSQGEFFEWSTLVEPYIPIHSAVALDGCRLIRIEAEALREAMHRHREMGYQVMSNLTKMLAQWLVQTQQTLIFERGWAMVS